jgi:Lrp/AsnC family leucine-responsive transcriptional regulator
MAETVRLDEIDRAIIRLLLANGRRSVSDIARHVALSPAPVARRIDRLERRGIIVGYTALVNQSQVEVGFEAFTELRFPGSTNVEVISRAATTVPEVVEVFTVAGDPDALVRIRVDSLTHLQQVVDRLRRNSDVIGTKTLVVLSSWRRTELSRSNNRTLRTA